MHGGALEEDVFETISIPNSVAAYHQSPMSALLQENIAYFVGVADTMFPSAPLEPHACQSMKVHNMTKGPLRARDRGPVTFEHSHGW